MKVASIRAQKLWYKFELSTIENKKKGGKKKKKTKHNLRIRKEKSGVDNRQEKMENVKEIHWLQN